MKWWSCARVDDFDDLTLYKVQLLGTIEELDGTPRGVDITASMADAGVTSSTARLYRSLHELEDDGLVAIGEKDGRTNEYELTERGRGMLTDLGDWMAA